jgi:spore germination protein KC
MKNTLILICICVILLTGCWNYRELNDLAVVVGMGIDKVEEGNEYRVSFQVVNPGSVSMGTKGGGGGDSTPVTVYSDTGHTIYEAMRKTSQKIPRQLFFAHIQVLILGESLVKEDGIKELFDFYERSRELRLNAAILVSRGVQAYDVLNLVTPLENMPATGIAKRMEVTSENWGQNVNVMVREVIDALAGQGEPAISGIRITGDAQSGGSKENIEKTSLLANLELSGIAIFKEGKLKTWVDGKEARGTLWIKDEMKGTIVNISCKNIKEGTSIELIRSKTNVEVTLKQGLPHFLIRIEEEGIINEVQCPIDLSKREVLIKLQEEWAKNTENEIASAIKTAKAHKSDIFGFGDAVKRKDIKAWKKMEKDWPTIFADSKVDVEINAYIRRIGMRTKPYLLEE